MGSRAQVFFSQVLFKCLDLYHNCIYYEKITLNVTALFRQLFQIIQSRMFSSQLPAWVQPSTTLSDSPKYITNYLI